MEMDGILARYNNIDYADFFLTAAIKMYMILDPTMVSYSNVHAQSLD